MILTYLSLPKQTHSRALTIAPNVPEPPRASRHGLQTSVDDNLESLATPVPDIVHSMHESTDTQ